ncbi:MAG: hypothetical protein IPM24_26930 [Bryobacterales bacterium]|nr:hypothetical protein [Bryobacterales bacterium]
MTAAQIAQALGGRKSGSGWTAKCPAHQDTNPSLSLTDSNGKLLVCCHAGCPQRAVVDALQAMGLWPESEQRDHPGDWGQRVATYYYADESGEVVLEVHRFIQPNGSKTFRQRRPDGKWTAKGTRRVPYRLPELIDAPIAFIVEGEKDVESLREHGFVATCNVGGAGKWMDSDSQYLRGREVHIIPDRDAPGADHAVKVARSLLGIAASISIITLPGNAKDISDWFAEGHSECELIAIVEGCHAV